jgi:RNA polymerase sigma-70 factor (ECF subfamily)
VLACSYSVTTDIPLAITRRVDVFQKSRSAPLALATDADLGRALVEGHPDAPHVAWRRFLPLVTRMLRRSISGGGETEDIAQAVFLCLFRRVHTLRNPLALRAFVIGVTLRVMREELRRRRKPSERARRHSEPIHSETMGHAGDAIPKHAFNNLCQLMRRLKQRERAAFVMRFVQGMDAAEIAGALGVSEPTARRSFSRAHKLVSKWAQHDPFLVDYVHPHSAAPHSADDI